MKKLLLCLPFILLISLTTYGKRIPGYFIDYRGDTIQVHFKVSVGFFEGSPLLRKMQNRVVYFNQEGEKFILRPADAQEIGFTYKKDTIRMLSRINTLGIITSLFHDDGYIFLKLEYDGPVKLFSYEIQNQGGGFSASGMPVGVGFSYTYDRYVLQNGNRPLQQVRGISFRRDMMDYFSDCPELVEKIDQRLYRKENLDAIVKEYNEYQLHLKGSSQVGPQKNGF